MSVKKIRYDVSMVQHWVICTFLIVQATTAQELEAVQSLSLAKAVQMHNMCRLEGRAG
jgi:hypothetical protein